MSAPEEPTATPESSEPATAVTSDWGRVTADGTVYVRTPDGEKAVGQYPEGTAEEALKFFTDRFDALAFEVDLLEKRVKAGALGPEEAAASVKTVRGQVEDANAVGDLNSLRGRLDSLSPVIAALSRSLASQQGPNDVVRLLRSGGHLGGRDAELAAKTDDEVPLLATSRMRGGERWLKA